MIERKEPTLGGPAPTDTSENRTRKPAPRPSEPSRQPPASRPAPSAAIRAAEKQNPSGNGLLYFTFLLALAGLAGSGYLAWQGQQQAQNAQAIRADLEARVAELEGKLSTSEDNLLESAEAMKAKLVWADSEIRKLWGVSYDTNRKAIAANTDAIEALSKKVDGNNSKLLADIKKQLGSVDGKLLAAQATVDEQLERLNTQISKLSGLEKQMGQLRNDLTSRIKTNEEAVKAIDIYRLTINRDLLALKDQVNNLQAK